MGDEENAKSNYLAAMKILSAMDGYDSDPRYHSIFGLMHALLGDTTLAIKEAKHLIKVFNALLNSEINEYENNLKTETNTSPIDPMKDNENIEILDLINKFNSKRDIQSSSNWYNNIK